MPALKNVLILGAGAAGSAAAQELAQHTEVTTTVIVDAQTAPYNRTLVNKAVATGFIDAQQAHLPPLSVPTIRDAVAFIDVGEHDVHLRTGARMHYDAIIVATGSVPRPLPAGIASPAPLDSDLVTSLHSLEDALRVRTVLEQIPSARVLIYGAGLIGAETAGILRHAGCRPTLTAASPLPGTTAFGAAIATRLADAHRGAVDTHFGHSLNSIDVVENEVQAVFADGREIMADLAMTVLGTTPSPPAPWNDSLLVDPRLRSRDHENVYAAGGVAVHGHAGATWRIDHWSDAVAQGAHAARSVLFDMELSEDPGPYQPSAFYSAQIHQHLYLAAGYTGTLGQTRTISTSPLVLAHEHQEHLIGVSGLDAAGEVMQLVPQLNASTTGVAHS